MSQRCHERLFQPGYGSDKAPFAWQGDLARVLVRESARQLA